MAAVVLSFGRIRVNSRHREWRATVTRNRSGVNA
jgi:hypothetical protein